MLRVAWHAEDGSIPLTTGAADKTARALMGHGLGTFSGARPVDKGHRNGLVNRFTISADGIAAVVAAANKPASPLAERKQAHTPAYLREVFDYDATRGVVRWRERPEDHFSTDIAHASFNAKHAGKVAQHRTKGRARVKLDDINYSLISIAWALLNDELLPAIRLAYRDGDPLNLRATNLMQSSRRMYRSARRGVYKHKDRYVAHVLDASLPGGIKNLGYFNSEAEARAARDKALEGSGYDTRQV